MKQCTANNVESTFCLPLISDSYAIDESFVIDTDIENQFGDI